MKKIKIFIDISTSETTKGTKYDSRNNNFIFEILSKYYEVEFSNEPDFVFFDHTAKGDYLKMKCTRIFYTFENIKPNFNICDYALTFAEINYEDRHFKLHPSFSDNKGISSLISILNRKTVSKDDVKNKNKFCCIVTSNDNTADPIRYQFFNTLNTTYKTVDSGGRAFNNIGEIIKDKNSFLLNYKFNIAFENSMFYTSEKIYDAFATYTIPIYWGNPKIIENINPKSFINLHDYKSYKEAIDRIIEIDNNIEIYLDILNEPIYRKNFDIEKYKSTLDNFLINIIEKGQNLQRDVNFIHTIKSDEKELIYIKYKKIMETLNTICGFFLHPVVFFKNSKLFKFNK